ncbi:MAG: TIGR04086 family membrane protein [Clostridia bacterium]|nr:TIGR04086 family membrane protein [Clostridia bacterium]
MNYVGNANGRSVFLKQFAKPILIGTFIGVLVCLIVLLLFAVLASSFDIPQAAVIPLALVASAIGAFSGGGVGGLISKKNGWLIGTVTSLLLYFISILAGLVLFRQIHGSVILIKAAIMLASGILGGIVAVNYSHERKRKKR